MGNGSNEISTRSGDNKGFIHAVLNQETEAVAYYVSLGMDVNFMDPEIMTSPLIEAVRLNHLEMVKILMDHGGNPTDTSQLGESAFKIAKSNGDQAMINLLGVKESYRSRFINFWKNAFS